MRVSDLISMENTFPYFIMSCRTVGRHFGTQPFLVKAFGKRLVSNETFFVKRSSCVIISRQNRSFLSQLCGFISLFCLK